MKREIRLLGIDDSPFDKHDDKEILVVGTVFRGGEWLDGVISTKVTVDGDDSTDKIVTAVNKCKFKQMLQAILLNGIAFGGFNVIDIARLNKETGIPVVVVTRKYPDYAKIRAALKKMGHLERYLLIEKAGKMQKAGNVHIQTAGISFEDAFQILKISCTRSDIPEPIRAAHIIAQGVVLGESKGKA